ncbi:MAG: hypothetical protein V4732_02250 [Pseudomonadota bacterium]
MLVRLLNVTFIVFLCALFALSSLSVRAEFVVSHRVPALVATTYYDYYVDLLKLAMERTRPQYGDYRFEGVPSDASTLRALSDVVQNAYPNLVLEMGYEDKLTETGDLTYINFPVDGGIVGYRICYLNPAIQKKITASTTLNDLRKYSIGQGVGWADTAVFRHNGFKVIEVDSFPGLFRMVAAGRIDLFCRGANQIIEDSYELKALEDSLQTKNPTKLIVDNTFVFVYPLPRFFYLHNKNTLAKERITAGLQLAYADGSLKKLWIKHYKASVDFVNLQHRQVFHLENPLLKNLPPDYKQYFFEPL